METDTGTNVIRARQRSRTALKAFSSPLNLCLNEVGVDRMQISVAGTWRIASPDSAFTFPPPITTNVYRDLLATAHWRENWFRKPEVRRDGTTILRTLQDAPTSLGALKIFIGGLLEGVGTYSVSVTCNPTKTLANLIASYLAPYGENCDFITYLERTSPFGFFDRFGVKPSLDIKENWLPDLDVSTRLLGSDIFGRFFPIFVDKL